MKRNNPYLLAAALLAVAFTGCKNDEYDNKSPFDNVVYLNVSENSDTQVTTFKKTLPDLPKTFSVVLSYPASQAVSVGVEVDPSLVETYNARHNTSWTMLDAKYYELSVTELTIPAGKTISDAVTLKLKNLDGSGEVEELPIDQTYLLPVTIADVGGGCCEAAQLRDGLLSGETLLGHHLGGLAARQLDQFPDARQGFGGQYVVQQPDGCDL